VSTLKSTERQPAGRVLSKKQAVLLAVALLALCAGAAIDIHAVAIGLIAGAMAFWTLFVGFRIVLWLAASAHRYPNIPAADVADPSLPSYTVLVPLYKEGRMLPRLIEAMQRLQYPPGKLEVLLLVEEDDEETWAVLRALTLPAHFDIKIVQVPAGGPRTKPNALNFGLFWAKGDRCVIYDAEDRPEPDQLLKAVAVFRRSPPDVACLQARLAFWNGTSSWITRFYWADYIIHFEWTLAGLARLKLVPPLGGTSNHFVTEALKQVAIRSESLPFKEGYVGGWDPFNVTEDAELAGALARLGYRVGMLDSTTWEEAAAHLRVADKQRRRWLKGFAQTGFMYTRHPVKASREMGVAKWFFYNLLMLGTPFTLVLNPFFWGATIVYFATRATVIVELFPLPLYYLGLTLMLAGNLALFYQLMAACMKREGFGFVKYMFLAPAWWLFITWSAYVMLFELIVRPHHWHKTVHGHDLAREEVEVVLTRTLVTSPPAGVGPAASQAALQAASPATRHRSSP